MPRFVIEGPDGSTYEVEAPEGATEAEVLERVRAESLRDQGVPQGRTGLQTAGDFFGDVVDNVLPNWGDELAGGVDAIGAVATGRPVGEAFREGQASFKSNQARYDQEHPTLSTLSTVGGLAASLALPGGSLGRGASLAAKMAHGVGIGAAYGTLSGAGEGETLSDRAENAVRSGAIGAGMGAAISPAFEGLSRANRWAKGSIPGYQGAARRLANVPRAIWGKPRITREANAHEWANRTLSQRMQEGHIATGMGQRGHVASPEAIAAEMESRQAMGVPAMPGDITEPLRRTTSWASRGMGPGQQRVIARLNARKAEEAARVRQHITETMGDVTDPLAHIERQAAASKARVAPLYDAAYRQPVVLTPKMEQVMTTPAFRDALPQAYQNIRNAMRDPEALGLRTRSDGTIDPEAVKTLSTEGFDQVIRAMRDNGRAAMDQSGFRPTNTTNSVHINARVGDLKDELAAQNESWRDATRLHADHMAQRGALDAGGGVAKLSGSEINEMSRSIPEAAHGSWALGARSALAENASEYGAAHPTANVAGRIRGALGDEAKQDAIGRMMGNNGAVRQLQQRLEGEHQGHLLWSEARGNSASADRLTMDADMDAAAGGGRLSGLMPRALAGRALDGLGRKAGERFNTDVKDRMSQVLSEQDPSAFRGHLSDIAGVAEQDAQRAVTRHNRASLLTKAAALNIVPDREDGQTLIDIQENPSGRPYGQYGRYEDFYDAEGNPL